MTTDDRRERNLGHVATLMASIHPGWDVAGCVAALRKLPADMPLVAIVYTAARYADDPMNETPAHIADLSNRAWDSFDPWPCRKHPRAGHRANGECGGCFADRRADENQTRRALGGRPVPDEAGQLIDEAITQRHGSEVAS